MLKLKSKIYAQALYQACQETSDLKLTLRNFAELLARHNKLGMFKSIIKEYVRIYNKEEKMADVFVTSAYALDAKTKEDIIELVKNIKSVRQAEIEQKIDPNIIGGLKINFDDYQIDTSIKRKLQLIKNNFNK